MLDQVILCGTVHTDIGKNFTNDIQLMVAGKNEIFSPLHLAGLVIDLLLHLNKMNLLIRSRMVSFVRISSHI